MEERDEDEDLQSSTVWSYDPWPTDLQRFKPHKNQNQLRNRWRETETNIWCERWRFSDFTSDANVAVEYVLTVLNRVTVASELQVVPSGSPLYTVYCRPYTASYMTIVSLCCVRVKPQKYKRLRAASCSTLCKRSTGLCLCCSEMTRHHILFLRTSSFQNRPEPRARPQDGRRRWERV